MEKQISAPVKSIRVNVNAAITRGDQLLVIEFKDENGAHYNLPGGGVEPGESLEAALKRECFEEISTPVDVGNLLLLWEYVPEIHAHKYGSTQKVGHVFKCELKGGVEPALPEKGDSFQIGVKWIPFTEIRELPESRRPPLFPAIGPELIRALTEKNAPVQIVNRA